MGIGRNEFIRRLSCRGEGFRWNLDPYVLPRFGDNRSAMSVELMNFVLAMLYIIRQG